VGGGGGLLTAVVDGGVVTGATESAAAALAVRTGRDADGLGETGEDGTGADPAPAPIAGEEGIANWQAPQAP
jgi:hypothetical protein